MHYRYPLPESLTAQAASLQEFANGGAQCHVRLKDGTVHANVLVSNSTAIIAMRGESQLPFSVADVAELFQDDEDRSPEQRANWLYFDSWTEHNG